MNGPAIVASSTAATGAVIGMTAAKVGIRPTPGGVTALKGVNPATVPGETAAILVTTDVVVRTAIEQIAASGAKVAAAATAARVTANAATENRMTGNAAPAKRVTAVALVARATRSAVTEEVASNRTAITETAVSARPAQAIAASLIGAMTPRPDADPARTTVSDSTVQSPIGAGSSGGAGTPDRSLGRGTSVAPRWKRSDQPRNAIQRCPQSSTSTSRTCHAA